VADDPTKTVAATPPSAAAPPATPPAAAAPASDAFDFETEYAKLDPKLRTEFETRVGQRAWDSYNHALEQEYGDLLPLVVEAKQNPEFRKKLTRLTDKELRDFLLDSGIEVYERTHAALSDDVPAGVTEDPRIKQLTDRTAALEGEILNERATRVAEAYAKTREQEARALMAEVGDDLKFEKPDDPGYKRMNHVVTIAEQRSEIAARKAGIDTSKPTWLADAVAKSVKMPTYREVYDELAEILGRSAPPAAPSTSRSGPPPAQPQAPRTAAEGRERALALLKQRGGFAAIAGRK
jgi:hypothetical protein